MPVERATAPPVKITFTPPDLEGRIVLGVFNEAGKLVRTLRPEPFTPDLKIDTNGYITEWDGRDDGGARCSAGRYSARGVVVGDAVEVRGEAYHFNDWVAEDGVPVTAVRLLPIPGVMAIEATVAGEETPRQAVITSDGSLAWGDDLPPEVPGPASAAKLPVDPIFRTTGRNGSEWVIVKNGEQNVVGEISSSGEALREFREPAGEPQPVAISASPDDDAILLLETAEGGVVRVRLLRKTQATEGPDGRAVSDWEVAFERTLQPCADFGVVEGRLVAHAAGSTPIDFVDVKLVPNELEMDSKPLRVSAVSSGAGSALAAENGLEFLPVTAQGGWKRFALLAADGVLTLYQGNGVGVEEFSVRNPSHIARFDAGSFLLAAEGE